MAAALREVLIEAEKRAQRERIVTLALAPRPMTCARPTLRRRRRAMRCTSSHHLTERRRAERLALRQQPAAGVDVRRRAASPVGARACSPGSHRPSSSQQQLAGGVGVLALDDVDVVGADAGRLVGVVRRPAAVGVGMPVSSMPASGRRLREHAAGQVRPQARRPQLHAAVAAAQHHRGGALVRASTASRGAAARTRPGWRARPRRSTGLRNMASSLATPAARFFTTTAARSSLVSPRSRSSRWARRAKYAGAGVSPACLLPRLEERRADHPLRHLLDAEHEHAVVLAAADRRRAERQRGRARRAAGLDVDDRAAGQRQRAEHAVPGGDAAVGGAAEGGADGVAVAGAMPASASAAAAACTPRSASVRSSKRPNGCSPTPAIATGHVGRSPGPTPSQVVDEVHRLALVQLRRVGLGQAADDAQVDAVERDDAEAVRDRSRRSQAARW